MRKLVIFLALAFVVALPVMALAGNGAPKGNHYTLNIHAHQNCPGDAMIDGDGHSIFCQLGYSDSTPIAWTPISQLNKTNKIFLAPGDDFQVYDANACDGDGAKFILPTNVVTTYQIWARALAKPDTSAIMTTCAIDNMNTPSNSTDDVYVCSTESVTLTRSKNGVAKFDNVTQKLLSICIDNDGVAGGACTRTSIFSNANYQYFWDYDNYGLRLAQLRFYPITP